MPLYDWVRELVSKYSFIDKVELQGSMVLLHYKSDEKTKVNKIPYRATRDQLIKRIEYIKNEIRYYEVKRARDQKVRESLKKDETRPMIFANIGEQNENSTQNSDVPRSLVITKR